MNSIYVVTCTEWEEGDKFTTNVVLCFERRIKAEEFISNKQKYLKSVYDPEYNIEIVEVIE